MLGLKVARPLYKLKKWSGIRDFKLLESIWGSSLWKMLGFKAARPLYKLKKWSGFTAAAFRGYFGSSLWKMLGLKAARLLYKLKKWSGIREFNLLEPILAHLFGRCSGLRLRDLSTS